MAAAVPDVGAAARAGSAGAGYAGAGSASAGSVTTNSTGRTCPASILLAEHEPEVAEMSARYLRRDGLRVRLVTAPELALAELKAKMGLGPMPERAALPSAPAEASSDPPTDTK